MQCCGLVVGVVLPAGHCDTARNTIVEAFWVLMLIWGLYVSVCVLSELGVFGKKLNTSDFTIKKLNTGDFTIKKNFFII